MSIYYDLYENPDKEGTEEQKLLHARVVPSGTYTTKEFVERVSMMHHILHAQLVGAVEAITDELQTLLDSDKTLVDDFVRYAARKGVAPRYGDIARSRRLIEAQLRAYIGRNTALEDNGFYANIYPVDNVVVRAIGILKEENEND